MEKLVQLMLTAFGNNFTYYLKAHNFHWTVLGPDFKPHHEFLGEIYGDAQGAIDDYAEQLRRIGAFPQGDYRDIVNNSQLQDPAGDLYDPISMYEALLGDLTILVGTLQDAYDQAGVVREYGLQNFLADRIDAHRKQQWMMTSTVVPESPIGE